MVLLTGWTAAFGAPTLTLSPGASTFTTFTVTSPPSVTGNTYTFPVIATNSMNNSYAATGSAAYVIGSTIAGSALDVSVSTDKLNYISNQTVSVTARAGATHQGDGLRGGGGVRAIAAVEELERHGTRGRGTTAGRVLRDDCLVSHRHRGRTGQVDQRIGDLGAGRRVEDVRRDGRLELVHGQRLTGTRHRRAVIAIAVVGRLIGEGTGERDDGGRIRPRIRRSNRQEDGFRVEGPRAVDAAEELEGHVTRGQGRARRPRDDGQIVDRRIRGDRLALKIGIGIISGRMDRGPDRGRALLEAS